MTLTLFHERRRPSRPRRAFTRADDDIIRAMCAAGATAVEIAAELGGRDAETIRHRAWRLGVKPRPLPKWRGHRTTELNCARCAILLAYAPAGHDGLCGWCSEEGEAVP